MGTAVTEAVKAIGDIGTDISSVGSALILIAVIALGIRWIKAMFF